MLAQLTGHYPAEVLLIGCQPEELEDYGGSLRPKVRQGWWTTRWHWRWIGCGPGAHRPVPARPAAGRRRGGHRADAVAAGLRGRQAGCAALACRIGDERFMPPAARSAAGA